MAKGMDTMIPRARRETLTQIDAMTLGHTEHENDSNEKISKEQVTEYSYIKSYICYFG